MTAPGSNETPLDRDGPPTSRTIDAGVVSHNDEGRIERSVRSLLDQRLPAGYGWGHIWIVASGCTDRTPEIARALAMEDGRIRLVTDPERRGKAAAIREVLHRAEADEVVLLNSDAIARAGAVAALLARGVGRTAPYAVMARPVLDGESGVEWSRTLEWMWQLHHEYHLDLLEDGRGTHLSDELLLLGGPSFPPLPTGVINDGSYLAVWLRQHGGECWYAPEALVEIETPLTRVDHLRQRRRIHVGNTQVARLLGVAPSTLFHRLGTHPAVTVRTLVRLSKRPGGARYLAEIAVGELLAHALAWWDSLPPARDHVLWQRVGRSGRDRREPRPSPSSVGIDSNAGRTGTDERIRALLETSGTFATGIRLDDLVDLLPADGPATADEARRWFSAHPEVGQVDGERVLRLGTSVRDLGPRGERGVRYRIAARRLLRGELASVVPWLRCAAVSGSTAYGHPDEGDDLDLFLVTRAGALWFSLARMYLALRIARWRDRATADPPVCLNYLLDDRSAPSEFARPGGFHIAREALTADPVLGERFYGSLLASARWMDSEIPRLYARKAQPAVASTSRPAPAGVRLLNAVIFPLLAGYLQLAGLRRNRQLAREGRTDEIFRTVTRWRKLSFDSRRFDSLRERHRARPSWVGAPPSSSDAPTRPSRGGGPTARRPAADVR